MSLQQLAKQTTDESSVRVTAEAIRKIESGRTSSPGAYLLDALARQLGTDLLELMYGETPPRSSTFEHHLPVAGAASAHPTFALLALELIANPAWTSAERETLAHGLQLELQAVRDRYERRIGKKAH